MTEQYIIYTMGNEGINEAVQKVLFDKGYSWLASGFRIQHTMLGIGINFFDDRPKGHLVNISNPSDAVWKSFREITFRELCELPDVHDESKELVDTIIQAIDHYWNYVKSIRFNQIIGWLFTIIAITLGAPFWFNTLGTLVNMRNAGAKPIKPKEPAE